MRYVLLLSFAFAARAQGFDHAQPRYTAMAQERPALRAYLENLSKVEEVQFSRWTKPEQMAFLINAYNAYTVEKVLTRYPNLKSIWDFGKFFEPRERYFAQYSKILSDAPGQQRLVADGEARLSFLDYDWSLNDSRSSSPR